MAPMYPFLLLLHIILITIIARGGTLFLFRLLLTMDAGWPGSVHDARVLVRSSFYKKLMLDNFCHLYK